MLKKLLADSGNEESFLEFNEDNYVEEGKEPEQDNVKFVIRSFLKFLTPNTYIHVHCTYIQVYSGCRQKVNKIHLEKEAQG